MDDLARLLEVARKNLTSKDLDRLTKGKKTHVKLWQNFSIGFELEVSAERGEVEDYMIDERFNENWDEETVRMNAYDEVDVEHSIEQDDLEDRLKTTENFMSGMSIHDFFTQADKAYFVKPKYGWADPMFAFGMTALYLMKRCLNGQLPPNLYNYYSIMSEMMDPNQVQMYTRENESMKRLALAAECRDMMAELRKPRENMIVDISDKLAGKLGDASFYKAIRTAPAEPSYLKEIQSLYDKYSEMTKYPDLLDINTLDYKGTPQAEKYKAGVYDENDTVWRVNSMMIHINQAMIFPSHQSKIMAIPSGGKAIKLLEFYDADENDNTKPDYSEEADLDEVIEHIASYCIDDVNAILESEFDDAVQEIVDDKYNQLREDIRQELEMEYSGDQYYALEQVQEVFEDEDGVESVDEDSSLNPVGGEIRSVVFKGRSGLVEAMEWLERMFDLIKNSYGLHTNETTGLHINVGTFTTQMAGAVEDVPSYKELDLFKLAVFLGEDYLLDLFNRDGNTFADKVLERLSRADNLQDVLTMDPKQIHAMGLDKIRQSLQKAMVKTAAKYSTANYTKLKENYIEFRFAGNEGYEKEFAKVKQSIARIILAIAAALDENMFREEYIKKILSVLSNKYRPLKKNVKVPSNIKKYYDRLSESNQGYVGMILSYPENSDWKINYIDRLACSGVWYQITKQGKDLNPIDRAKYSELIHKVVEKITNEKERITAYRQIRKRDNPNIDMKSVRLILFGTSGRPNMYRNTRSVRPK